MLIVFAFLATDSRLPSFVRLFSRDLIRVYFDMGNWARYVRGLVMTEIYRRLPRWSKVEFSFVGNDRRPSQKSGTCRENRNAPDFSDLSPTIPDDRGYLRFWVFISRQNLGQSRSSKIPDRPSGIFPTYENQVLRREYLSTWPLDNLPNIIYVVIQTIIGQWSFIIFNCFLCSSQPQMCQWFFMIFYDF